MKSLEEDLEILTNQRRKLVKEIDEIDTQIIGLRLQLDRLRAKELYQLEQDRSRNK